MTFHPALSREPTTDEPCSPVAVNTTAVLDDMASWVGSVGRVGDVGCSWNVLMGSCVSWVAGSHGGAGWFIYLSS
jgi:hypothetical protein